MRLMATQTTSLLCLSASLMVDPSRQSGRRGTCGHDSEGGRLCDDHEVGDRGGDGVCYSGGASLCRLRRFCHTVLTRRSMWLCIQLTVMVLKVLAQCEMQ